MKGRLQTRRSTLEDRASFLGPSIPLASSSVSGRSVLAGLATAASATSEFGLTRPAIAVSADLAGIRALAFDIYGTSVDYWGTIVGQGQALGHRKNLAVDWPVACKRLAGVSPELHGNLPGQAPLGKFHRIAAGLSC